MTKKGYTFEIKQSDDSESPREWCNVSKFALFHNRYNLPNESHLSRQEFDSLDSWDCVGKELIKQHDIYPSCIKPVYMYDHSGTSLSTSPFSCPWDSGQVGFIFVDKNIIKKEKMTRIQAIKSLDSEFNVYNQYIQGDVWEFIIRDETGECVDSLSGCYGYEYAEAEALSIIEALSNTEGQKQ